MKKQLFIPFLVTFIIILAFLGLYLYKFHYELSSDHSDWGNFGGYFAGSIGVCFSLLSVYLMYLAFREQRKQNLENYFQQFITNYYSLLEGINENWLHGDPAKYQNGREIFGNAVMVFDLEVLDREMRAKGSKVSIPEITSSSSFEKGFYEVYKLHINVFEHYCNYIIYLLESIIESKDIDKQKNIYINRFLSLMSTFEFIFFSYYVKYLCQSNHVEEIKKALKEKLDKVALDNFSDNHKSQVKFIKEEYSNPTTTQQSNVVQKTTP